MKLTESQRTLVSTSLRIAVEKYKDNAKLVRNMQAGQGYERIAVSFDTQAKDAVELANLFDNAEYAYVNDPVEEPANDISEDIARARMEKLWASSRYSQRSSMLVGMGCELFKARNMSKLTWQSLPLSVRDGLTNEYKNTGNPA